MGHLIGVRGLLRDSGALCGKYMVVSINRGTPEKTHKYCNTITWGPPKGAPNFPRANYTPVEAVWGLGFWVEGFWMYSCNQRAFQERNPAALDAP